MFEQPPVFEKKHGEEEESTRTSGQSQEDEEEVIIYQKREKGGDTWEEVVDEPEEHLTLPMTAETLEEAIAVMAKRPKHTIKTPPYRPDPIYEWNPYDEAQEIKSISQLFYNRERGGESISEEDSLLLSKKEQEWRKETSDAKDFLGYFEKNKSSEEKELLWEESFGKNPNLFLETDSLDRLKDIPQEERIFMLAKASRFISNSPKDFAPYAKAFPEDVEKIKALFIDEYMPRETDNGEYRDDMVVAFKMKEEILDEELKNKLFSLSVLEINRIDPELKNLFLSINYFTEIAQKRNIAKDKMPEGFSENTDVFFKEYPEASDDFVKILNGKNISKKQNLKREDFLSEKYEELGAEDKSRILRKFLEYTQYAMVFRETFNRPDIKEEFVEQENFYDVKNRYGSSENYDPRRQSLLYSTEYEPVAYTQETESEHGKDIEMYLNNNPHYNISKIILEEFKKTGSAEEKDQNTKTIVGFWNKNRSPLLLKNACDSLSSQNPSLAASGLYDLIKEEKGDKDSLLAALYRLELGTMGISENGMDYLGEKKFDLGDEFNKPEFNAERITNTGAIGIFKGADKEKELMKFFYLEGLDGDEIEIKAKLMDVTLDTLSMEKLGDTDEEKAKKKECLEELKKNYYKITNDRIFTETGVRLNNLSFREQGSFVVYFNEADENAKDELRDFVNKYGEEGIKSFLALEAGDKEDTGRRILEIGKELKPEVAEVIFEKCAEIVDQIEKSKEEIAEMFNEDKDVTDEEIRKINENLLERANKLITHFSDEFQTSDNREDLELNILHELERHRKDMILMASVYRTLKKEGREDVKVEDIKDVSFEIITAAEISTQKDFVAQMKDIYKANYASRPAFRDKLVEKFTNTLETQGDKTKFYIYAKGGRIIAFNRFDQRGEGRKYFGSFNVDLNVQNSCIGDALFKASIDKESKENEIEATCDIFSVATIMYVEKGHFVATEFIPASENMEEPIFHIEKGDAYRTEYQDKKQGEIISEYEERQKNNINGENPIILKLDAEMEKIAEVSKELLGEKKYLLSRYFCSEDRKQVYCVFEKR